MRILIILPEYFPKQNPRVFRWKALAEHWAAKGREVVVLCGKHREHPVRQKLNGVEVNRAGQANMMDWLNNIVQARRIRRRELGAETPEAGNRSLTTRLLHLFHKIWAAVYWPDGSCIWILSAWRAASAIGKKRPPEVVISVSLPFSSHLVGWYCHKRWPSARWVADIGDPFSFPGLFPRNNPFFYRRLNHLAERWILFRAHAVSVTVEGARQAYLKRMPETGTKLHVIPPLYAGGKSDEKNGNLPLEKGKVHIGYFGSFYTGIRSPLAALEVFGQLCRVAPALCDTLHLHFTGYFEEEFQEIFQKHSGYGRIVFVHQMLPPSAVGSAMQQFDFLLNIGNNTTCQLPSKCVDYMQSGKPVVNICQRKDDTFATFFEGYPLICNVLFGDNGFERRQLLKVLDFLNKQRGEKVGKDWLDKRLDEYSVESVANMYGELFL